jgi:hypothetical protein
MHTSRKQTLEEEVSEVAVNGVFSEDGVEPLAILERADREKRVIASNLELDAVLRSGDWNKWRDAWACWSGTLVAYKASGVPFGETVEFRGWVFKVPKQFQAKTNSVLVVNHPDFRVEGETFIPGKSVACIPIPAGNGWYKPDPVFGIPNAEKTGTEEDGYLYRQNEDYVGLVVRWDGGFVDDLRRYVGLFFYPGYHLGVLESDRPWSGKVPKHVHEWETKCKLCREVRGK